MTWVASVEQSSATVSTQSPIVWARILSMASAMYGAALYAGITNRMVMASDADEAYGG